MEESELAVDKGKANMNKSERGNKETPKVVCPHSLDLFDSVGYTHTHLAPEPS